MTRFQPTERLHSKALLAAGEKVQLLAQLRTQGLPVLASRVLGPELWQRLLRDIWPQPVLSALTKEQLRQHAQALRAAVATSKLAPAWSDLIAAWPGPLMLRASIALHNAQGEAQPLPAEFQGTVAGQLCGGDSATCGEGLKRLWTEMLSLRNLLVWQRHSPTLEQIQLSLLVHPAQEADVSGTLVISGSRALIEAVVGHGSALSQGEAIPARCWCDRNQRHWQAGHQEHRWQLQPDGQLQRHHRPHPQLPAPLTTDQLNLQLEIAERIQQQLGAVRLEWLWTGHTYLITQIQPWQEPLPPAPDPDPGVGISPQQINAVMRGMAAASGRCLGPAFVLNAQPSAAAPAIPPGSVLVALSLQPDIFATVDGIVGVVTEQGGATCHAAILARELGVPAVVGTPQATQLVQTGDYLWLDGDRGLVYIIAASASASASIARPLVPSTRAATTRTRLMLNLSQPSGFTHLLAAADGVGLVRSEWLLLKALGGDHPQLWIDSGRQDELQALLVRRLEPILAACPDRPVRYRSMDLRSHEWTTLRGSPAVDLNPTLGVRGSLSYQLDPRLFQTELRALATLQQRGYDQLQLILPFVRTVEEVRFCRSHIDRAHLQQGQFQLWIMAEVPSVLFLLPDYVQAGVEGIAIGTNDLTQLLLGIDRDQPLLAALYDESHPAVVAALEQLVRQARQLNIPCCLCGQAPVRFPDLIDRLVAWGIDELSVEGAALDSTRQAIRRVEERQSP